MPGARSVLVLAVDADDERDDQDRDDVRDLDHRVDRRAGGSIALIAEPVTISIAGPYSGRAGPSRIPGISRNWRRTSVTTSPPTRPTAVIASAAKRNGMSPPMKSPEITHGSS